MSNTKIKKGRVSKKNSDARTTASALTFVIIFAGFLLAAQSVRPNDIQPANSGQYSSLNAQATGNQLNSLAGVEALEPQVLENYRTLMLNSPRSVVEKELATQFEDGNINSKQFDQLMEMLNELSTQ